MSLESADAPGSGRRARLLDDPQAIRALAHPIRLQLQSIIGRAGRITAAEASRELGISHALASHHLRQLKKYGFVYQVEGADNRERPWQLTDVSFTIDGVEDKPGGAHALAVFEQLTAERALAEFSDWQQHRQSWAPGWRASAGVRRSTVYLTEDELGDLVQAIDDCIVRYIRDRPIDDIASRPAGSRAVGVTLFATPQEPTAAES